MNLFWCPINSCYTLYMFKEEHTSKNICWQIIIIYKQNIFEHFRNRFITTLFIKETFFLIFCQRLRVFCMSFLIKFV